MAEYKVDTTQIRNYASQISGLQSNLNRIAAKLTGLQIGRSIQARATLQFNLQIADCKWAAINQLQDLGNLARGLEAVAGLYEKYEKELSQPKTQAQADREHGGDGRAWDEDSFVEWLKLLFEYVVYDGTRVNPMLLTLISPVAPILYITSGLYFGRTPSFFDAERTPNAGTYGDWWGYETAVDHPGITAWAGKTGAYAENEWGYANVDAYLGKVEADADAEFAFMKKVNKNEYRMNEDTNQYEWTEKESFAFVHGEVEAGTSLEVLSADGKAGVGSDMLGAEVSADGSLGNAAAEGKVIASVGEDGVNVYARGKAMVSAAEGSASGTINILGLEITGNIGGYAGALGVEGKIGVEDNKWVMKGGAAALFGVSIGVEIGFNDEGWENVIDFVTFWD